MSHKGITCPACGVNSLDGEEFYYVADCQVWRDVRGFRGKRLIVDTYADDHTEDANARLHCKPCGHEFAIPEDVLDNISWECRP